MKKNYSFFIILALLLGGYIIFSLLITNSSLNTNAQYIFINDSVKWSYNSNWTNMEEQELSKLNLENCYVYNNKKYVGNYTLTYNQGWYVDNKLYNNEFMAYKGNKKFKYIEFTNNNLSYIDLSIVNKVLEDNDISKINNIDDIAYKNKIIIDLDNDNKNEMIYFISNMDSEVSADKYYSLLFLINDDSYQIIQKSIITNLTSIAQLNDNEIYAIIDLDGDNKYEIIVSKEYFSRSNSKYTLYQLEKNSYKELISN